MGVLEQRGPRWVTIGPALAGLSMVILLGSGGLGPAMMWLAGTVLVLCIALVSLGLWPGPRRPKAE